MTETQITLDLLEKTPFRISEQLLDHMATRKMEAFSRTHSGHEACNVEHLFWELAKDRWVHKNHDMTPVWSILTEAQAESAYRFYGGK